MESLVMSHWNIESITIKRGKQVKNLEISCVARGKVWFGFFSLLDFLQLAGLLEAEAKLILNSLNSQHLTISPAVSFIKLLGIKTREINAAHGCQQQQEGR